MQLDEDGARGAGLSSRTLKVATASGATVPLSVVADLDLGVGPSAIDRYDRTRRVLIGADLVGKAPLGEGGRQLLALPGAKTCRTGVVLQAVGDAEVMGEVFASFATAMGAGIMLVHAVLVLLFADLLQPITILVSLPLSVGGAIVALCHHRPVDHAPGRDRLPDADGHRHQERHPAGRLRHR